MKFAWLILVALAVYAKTDGIVGIGQTCDKDGLYVVSNFTVSPFPVTSGIQMTFNMVGTFRTNIYVANVAVRTSYNKGHWVYKYEDIDQSFSNGQIYTFSFTLTSGTGNGEYLEEIFLEEKQGKGISCWTFTYTLG